MKYVVGPIRTWFASFLNHQVLVKAVSKQTRYQNEAEADRCPDHDGSQKSHQYDPDEGQNKGHEKADPDQPPSLFQIVEYSFAKVTDREKSWKKEDIFLLYLQKKNR